MTDDHARLEQLATDELRENAVDLAKQQWDVRFFWTLLSSLPAAEAAAGHPDAGDTSVAQASGMFYEALGAEPDPDVQEALRPLYIDYLAKHSDGPGPAESGS